MLLQYLRTTFGTMRREGINTVIAVLGLTVGLLAFAFVCSYCLYFHEFDRQVTDYRQWYRVRLIEHDAQGQVTESASMIPNSMPPMMSETPQVKDFMVFLPGWGARARLTCDGKPLKLGRVALVSRSFIENHQIHMLNSLPDSVFSSEQNLIVSRSWAKQHFGNENPVGKKIMIRDHLRSVITGVFEDLPPTLHLRADGFQLWTYDGPPKDDPDTFYGTAQVLVRIPDPKAVPAVEQSFNRILKQHPYFGGHFSECTVKLDPMTKIHFMSGLEEDEATVNPKNIATVALIGILILLAALLNFINLLSLGWRKRIDEFSARRAVGAGISDIFRQLSVEFGVHFLLAGIFAVILYAVFLGTFAQLVGLDLASVSLLLLNYWPFALLGAFLVLGISGGLATWRFSQVSVMSEEQRYRTRQAGNQAILFAQLAIGTVFVLSALAVTRQMHFVEAKDLGYKADHTYEYFYLAATDMPVFADPAVVLETIRNVPGVLGVSGSNFSVVTEDLNKANDFPKITVRIRNTTSEIQARLGVYWPGFMQQMGLKILQGRENIPDARNEVVVNQTFCNRYLDREHPLGSVIEFPNPEHPDSTSSVAVVGVINDACFFPLHVSMPPMLFGESGHSIEYFQVNVDPIREKEVIAAVNRAFDEISRGTMAPLDYSVIEVRQKLREFYHDDNIYAHMTIVFAIIIALIALVGNYVVTSLHLRRQMKDIAIRKVCGAEFRDIFRVYVRGYLYLFGGAVLVGGVVGEMMIRLFLDRFALHAPQLWTIYPLSLMILVIIVFVPFYLNLRKAYRVDPTVYLQSE